MALKVRKKHPFRRQLTPQRVAAAERRGKSLRRTAWFAGWLFILAVGAGAGYTWYMGEQEATVTAAEPTAPSRRVEIKPIKQDPNANVGVSIQTLSTPVKAGSNASVMIRTNQRANCVITVMYGTVKGQDSGLIKKTADDFGTVGWSWTVPADTQPGKAPVKIDCATAKKSGSVTADLMVER